MISVVCLVLSYIMFITCKAHIRSPIPYGWESMCKVENTPEPLENYHYDVIQDGTVTHIRCAVSGDDAGLPWRFQTLRDWLHPGDNHGGALTVFVTVDCVQGGSISLPWPMKSHGLIGLKVTGCRLTGKYDDFGNTEVENIPEQLRVLDIRDSVWVSDPGAFEKITTQEQNLASLSSEYDCGQDSSIEVFITRNVSDDIGTLDTDDFKMSDNGPKPWDLPDGPLESEIGLRSLDKLDVNDQPSQWNHVDLNSTGLMDMAIPSKGVEIVSDNSENDLSILPSDDSYSPSSTKQDAVKQFEQLLKGVQSLKIMCNYKKLEILDESVSTFMPVLHFTIMLQDAKYPEVQILNYSRTGMREIPNELQQFRTHFPKLKYLDLSHNYISDLKFLNISTDNITNDVIIDLQHNEITNLTLTSLIDISKADKVLIDIRGNPIYCSEEIFELSIFMQKSSFFTGDLRKYDYIKDIECAAPSHLVGVKLIELATQGSSGLTSDEIVTAASCSAAALVVVVIFAAVALFVLRRKGRRNIRRAHPPGIRTDSTKDIITDA